jgi:uncharacterized protein YjbI with pentapeptide repeats
VTAVLRSALFLVLWTYFCGDALAQRAAPSSLPPGSDVQGQLKRGEPIGKGLSRASQRLVIPAEAISQLIDEDQRAIHVPIEIHHAVILGALELQYVKFERDVSLTDVEFSKRVDFSFAVFDRLVMFGGSSFGGTVAFTGAVMNRGVDLNDTHLMDVDLRNAQVNGDLDFLHSAPRGEFRLDSAVIRGGAAFSGTTFSGPAVFYATKVKGPADFRGCDFGETRFDHADFGGDVFFRAVDETVSNSDIRTKFEKKLVFSDVHVTGESQFQDAVFLNGANFEHLRADGVVFFNGASFKGSAQFASASFGSEAQFDGTTFEMDENEDKIDFDNVRFQGLSSFDDSKIYIPITFTATDFEQPVTFDRVKFFQQADFTTARSHATLSFFDTTFFKGLVLYGASFPVISFTKEPMDRSADSQFKEKVDLRNFSYQSLTVAWRDLLDKNTDTDRQPYAQLEKVLRSEGHDDMADEVYLTRREAERNRLSFANAPVTWTLNWAYYLVAGYGVRPLQLVVFCAILLSLGTILFSIPGAVVPKDAKLELPPSPELWQRLAIALQYFLPAVDIPGGSDWIPQRKTIPIKVTRFKKEFNLTFNPSIWTTIVLRIPGLILVPLLLGVTTGLIRTISP